MKQTPSPLGAALRTTRIVSATFVVTLLFYIFLGERARPSPAKNLPVILLALTAFAVADVWIAFFLRRKLIAAAEEKLQSNPQDARAIVRWRAGQLTSSVLAEAIGLQGFVLRFLGATFYQVAPFYLAAILLLLLWWPQSP